ncbi:uncharacterized protein [Aegilops tauschii subsp. strangulata]|uniref:uncharacterized protein n=1 Tax=Aegilops tauschii subsp. strangulata TaxID=200361 RepID=UPI003CC86DA3
MGENYTTWAIKVEADLDAAGLWEAVVPPEDATSVVIAKKDKPARAYLLQALADDLLLQVAAKKTAAEIWSSLKIRFIGADRVRAARLASLRNEFELLWMDGGESLDAFAGKISGMAAHYAGLGSNHDDTAMVKKLLDCVPDHLYATFKEALWRLKAFEERVRRRGGSEQADGQLMYTAAQWQARQRRQGGGGFNDDDGAMSTASGGGDNRRGKCYKCGVRGHFKRECPLLWKEPAAERALLVKADVEHDGLL